MVVFGPLGDGSCRQCHRGNEQICNQGHWIGFRPARRLSGVRPRRSPAADQSRAGNCRRCSLAPLTDAGRSPDPRVEEAGAPPGRSGPEPTLAVVGSRRPRRIRVRSTPKLLGGGATVVAFARNDEQARRWPRKTAPTTRSTSAVSLHDEVRDRTRTSSPAGASSTPSSNARAPEEIDPAGLRPASDRRVRSPRSAWSATAVDISAVPVSQPASSPCSARSGAASTTSARSSRWPKRARSRISVTQRPVRGRQRSRSMRWGAAMSSDAP